jgi:hypothetical protein
MSLLLLALLSTSCGLYTHEAAGLRRLELQAGGQTGQYRSLANRNSLRFLVFGDFGSASEAQIGLGKAMKSQCDADGGCDFALVVGDNIYNSGPRSDADFEKKFESPYQDFGRLDFWMLPGNHDWSGEGSVQREIDHTSKSDRWRMPFNHFAVPDLPPWVHIYGFDTTIFEKSYNGDSASLNLNKDLQLQAARRELCGKTGWRLAFGHHAIYSGGEHGAPSGFVYKLKRLVQIEKRKNSPPGILEEQQAILEPFIRECRIQVYFSGHDHNQELIDANGFLQVVQGAGGKGLRDVKDTSAGGRKSVVRASEHGFAIVDLTPERMRMRFFECGTKSAETCTAREVVPSLQP